MKKYLIMLILLFMPVFVYAADCPVILDTQTNDDRELTCDFTNGNKTITKFSTTSEKTVLSNGICSVKCTETIAFSIDPIKKVLSGTSFNYPLYVSGERKCVATYDYVAYETEIKRLTDEYAALTGDAKTTKGNELVNYYDKKKQCDEFTLKDSTYQNIYKMNGDVKLSVQTSKATEVLKYTYKSMEDYYSQSSVDKVRYYACNYNENTKQCDETTEAAMRTVSSWKETARLFGKYTMPTVYVERYTGEVTKVSTATTCNAGDRYFVNFSELTNPKVGEKDNKGYTLTLTATGLGNNLISTENTWNLKVNCWYQVKNLSFPNGGATVSESDTDESYDPYGSVAFKYRLIDLAAPFPGRDPGANWYGKESLITPTIETNPKFLIYINSSLARKVRKYNESNPYVTFKLYVNEKNQDRSYFVENNTDIITREW